MPCGRDIDEGPVWEPLALGYLEWIGKEYEKKREAMLQFIGADQAATTDMMDINTKFNLISEYRKFAYENMDLAEDFECRRFFEGFSIELDQEF